MSTPTVKNVSKDYRELDGYESFADWIADVENNVYIGTNATRYAQSPTPESRWVMGALVRPPARPWVNKSATLKSKGKILIGF